MRASLARSAMCWRRATIRVPPKMWAGSDTVIPQSCFTPYRGGHETRFVMMSKTLISLVTRLGAPLIAFVLTVVPSVLPAHAVEDARKVSVVSFGLFGDQSVFRSEATVAAKIVADRFGHGPVDVQYNSKKGGKATIETFQGYRCRERRPVSDS